jgi:glycosyltransferase involved in cell wall biosynthesis
MHILYLCQVVPYPPDAGPKVRAYYTLSYLAFHHEVTLLAFSRPDDPPAALDHLRQFCIAVHTVPLQRSTGRNLRHLLASQLNRRSFIIQRDDLPAMSRKVEELLATGAFDAVHADQLWMAQYVLHHNNGRGSPVKTVLDEHNACYQIFQRLAQGESNLARRFFLNMEWPRLRRFEATALARFDHVVAVTPEDRQTLQSLLAEPGSSPDPPDPQFAVIPICVETAAARPVTSAPAAQDVLHLGTMFWPPNVEGVLWFARQVWPLVRQQVPGATFTIAGKNPPPEVRALAGAPASGITVTGYVADPQPYLQRAAAFIVPLHSASGMRVKIVDAWRWGLPVVSTSIGAEGIQYCDGENLLIADDPPAFALAVVRLLTDPDLNNQLRRNGRRWVETHYDWQRRYPAWDLIYPPERGHL